MYNAHRTSARPPHVTRRPRRLPLSQFSGATPTNLAICSWLNEPSSGKADIRQAWVTAPIPLQFSINFSLSAKCSFSCAATISSIFPISLLSTLRTASILLRWIFGLISQRLSSVTRISMSWRRRAINACNAICFGSGRHISNCSRFSDWYSVCAKWLSTRASIASVLARNPIALAKSCACRGLTTITGSPARHKATAAWRSKPPVASRTTAPTLRCALSAPSSPVRSAALIAANSAAIPFSSLPKHCVLLLSSSANSKLSLETSIPTKIISEAFIITPPCKCEVIAPLHASHQTTVRALDKRLTLYAKSFPTGLVSQRSDGLYNAIRKLPVTSNTDNGNPTISALGQAKKSRSILQPPARWFCGQSASRFPPKRCALPCGQPVDNDKPVAHRLPTGRWLPTSSTGRRHQLIKTPNHKTKQKTIKNSIQGDTHGQANCAGQNARPLEQGKAGWPKVPVADQRDLGNPS